LQSKFYECLNNTSILTAKRSKSSHRNTVNHIVLKIQSEQNTLSRNIINSAQNEFKKEILNTKDLLGIGGGEFQGVVRKNRGIKRQWGSLFAVCSV